jgi:uncharacterized protein YggU (UPF0235/DUF167 family)
MLGLAIRCVAARGAKSQTSSVIHIICHVKPGVSATRQGITSLTPNRIEMCIAAQARDGEASAAVREVIAKVPQLPKSDIKIAKSVKSREKTVAVRSTTKTPEDEVARIKTILLGSVCR